MRGGAGEAREVRGGAGEAREVRRWGWVIVCLCVCPGGYTYIVSSILVIQPTPLQFPLL